MQNKPILVINSGSSSIKFSLFHASEHDRTKLFEGAVDGIGTDRGSFWIKDASGKKLRDETPALPTRNVAFKLVTDTLRNPQFPYPAAIGHRMVAGGPNLTRHQRITPEVLDEMERNVSFAPLHTPIAAYIMREARVLFPDVPNFVCFDTAFHTTIPEVAQRFAIPEKYWKQGVRRYGAHGISYESIVYQLEQQKALPERLIVAHLGNGASITAIRKGKSLDTSMGLTPTGGLISGTRTGDIDPGVLLYILRDINGSADELETIAAKKSGLLGVSQISNDMRELRDAIAAGNQNAAMAVALFAYSVKKFISSYIGVLGGLDMLVFTGGIGENDIAARAEICAGLEHLGITLDAKRNNVRGEAVISSETSPVLVRVIPPAEDLLIVNHVYRMMQEK
ncbi:MAG TPA: acetate/propionate family kinase [Acidisarcina sp.]|nr:acetate/propionate family kinase [Acidisarcina sp.]